MRGALWIERVPTLMSVTSKPCHDTSVAFLSKHVQDVLVVEEQNVVPRDGRVWHGGKMREDDDLSILVRTHDLSKPFELLRAQRAVVRHIRTLTVLQSALEVRRRPPLLADAVVWIIRRNNIPRVRDLFRIRRHRGDV